MFIAHFTGLVVKRATLPGSPRHSLRRRSPRSRMLPQVGACAGLHERPSSALSHGSFGHLIPDRAPHRGGASHRLSKECEM